MILEEELHGLLVFNFKSDSLLRKQWILNMLEVYYLSKGFSASWKFTTLAKAS